MRRKRWVALVALSFGTMGLLGWAYLRQPALDTFDAGAIRSVEVEVYPWGDEETAPPGVTSNDPNAISELMSVLRGGAEMRDHKCGSRGGITVRRAFGRPLVVEFLPGHHTEWYEFRYDRKAYRVSRAAFVDAMRRLGVAVPLQC